ncbi:hypothetical protein D3C76_1714320 [compost metagenome]
MVFWVPSGSLLKNLPVERSRPVFLAIAAITTVLATLVISSFCCWNAARRSWWRSSTWLISWPSMAAISSSLSTFSSMPRGTKILP